ncbi:MAG: glycyl-radical enzyme activating protein [Proteobacteria bacterium]|nr:glycyl-radical enzyme activating protein [Pseudomonadota bacterium]MBU1137695.1 glycyl-radical enzyme activating protein [Pseudomonadota bacterium]MBU1231351.1 glycyl-radical enzyme activating protein [Pseudomonadota bacterium]MBU1417821.1 glycyl-radical enzyme activating protein [Pseudomonadota bacterium]MBU1453169.1 glycyl-radical enzyme activating protein [Pseudomonadota bacterium]
MKALVGNINRYALHDGPGIRTTVFFKGCTLHCPWCHNPELISPEPEVAFYPERCITCGDCLAVCPQEAIRMQSEDRVDRKRCTGCGLCAESCPSGALARVGREYELEELIEILLRDRMFYKMSGGGVTLSGGEPTQQLLFISALLNRLRHEGIHTTLETNGLFFYEQFAAACLDYLDLIFFDLKFADSAQHQKVLGCCNRVIWENLSSLLTKRAQDVIVRIPMIPGYTATHENIDRIGRFLRQQKAQYYSLLPYNPYGLAKAAAVSMTPDQTLPEQAMDQSELLPWQEFFYGMALVTP